MTYTNPVSSKGGGTAALPNINKRAPELQHFEEHLRMPIGLSDKVCESSVLALNHILANTMVLRDLYKKHHWQVSGPTFYQLHLLYDKHFEEQSRLVDSLAERIQTLGGISIAMSHDVVELSTIERPPRGREQVPVQLSRLIEAHSTILKETRAAATGAAERGDDGTNDILVSDVIRTGEMHVWFLSEHIVHSPLSQNGKSADHEN